MSAASSIVARTRSEVGKCGKSVWGRVVHSNEYKEVEAASRTGIKCASVEATRSLSDKPRCFSFGASGTKACAIVSAASGPAIDGSEMDDSASRFEVERAERKWCREERPRGVRSCATRDSRRLKGNWTVEAGVATNHPWRMSWRRSAH